MGHPETRGFPRNRGLPLYYEFIFIINLTIELLREPREGPGDKVGAKLFYQLFTRTQPQGTPSFKIQTFFLPTKWELIITFLDCVVGSLNVMQWRGHVNCVLLV